MSNVYMTEEQMSRYLSGEASTEEVTAMQQWLEASEANRRKFDALQTIWMLSGVARPQETATEEAWLRMKQRTVGRAQAARVIPWRRYVVRAAAVLLLAAGAYAGKQYADTDNSTAQVAVEQDEEQKAVPPQQAVSEKMIVEPPVPEIMKETIAAADERDRAGMQVVPPPMKRNEYHEPIAKKRKEEVCNTTQCPLEICIVQTLACKGDEPAMAAHCSMLRPNESAALQYSLYHGAGACEASVKEIRITRMNTGETIVLNETSPVTAEEFFHYITGYKKGELEAGVFEADCNNLCMNQSIVLDNSLGTLVLQ